MHTEKNRPYDICHLPQLKKKKIKYKVKQLTTIFSHWSIHTHLHRERLDRKLRQTDRRFRTLDRGQRVEINREEG